jgi:hypothetical protein
LGNDALRSFKLSILRSCASNFRISISSSLDKVSVAAVDTVVIDDALSDATEPASLGRLDSRATMQPSLFSSLSSRALFTFSFSLSSLS